ncbi:MAG: sulfatase-like hydrolase/transferase, partial [Candidatus Nanohaloarchaea archaeon]|nr:sulfatase-like hydrolase/transferase [Candidatus Nanohaloarchaea archaeon]
AGENVNLSSTRELRFTRDMYDNGVYYTDKAFGRFMRRLKQQGIYDDALIIVFSDHGETLGEDGNVGHDTMHQDVLRTFLAVKYPHQEKRVVVNQRATLRDIYPTVLRAMNADYNGTAIPLREIARGRGHNSVFAEKIDRKALIDGKYKLITHVNSSRIEIYNIEKDPDEQRNLYPEKDIHQMLKTQLSGYPDRNYSAYCSSGFESVRLGK